FVQQWFPQMAVISVYQRDFRFFLCAPRLWPNCVAISSPPAPPPTITIFFNGVVNVTPLKFINQLLIKSY
ncbi:hypothetical protein Y094_22585, partial [Salmonella enterica subsp. enterica serovar Tennessee]